jgi:hypothetical protein
MICFAPSRSYLYSLFLGLCLFGISTEAITLRQSNLLILEKRHKLDIGGIKNRKSCPCPENLKILWKQKFLTPCKPQCSCRTNSFSWQPELLSLPSDLALAQDWPIIGLVAPPLLRISSKYARTLPAAAIPLTIDVLHVTESQQLHITLRWPTSA